MNTVEQFFWIVFWGFFIIYTFLSINIKRKGLSVYGTVKDSKYDASNNRSKVKVDVGDTIKSFWISGKVEPTKKVKLIKYKMIYITESLYNILIPLWFYGFPTLIILFCISVKDHCKKNGISTNIIDTKVFILSVWFLMLLFTGLALFYYAKILKQKVEYIKTNGKYTKNTGHIIEKNKKNKSYQYIVEFIDNDIAYKKEIWTSALKEKYKIGDEVDIYYNPLEDDSAVYVTRESKDNGKANLACILGVTIIILGLCTCIFAAIR